MQQQQLQAHKANMAQQQGQNDQQAQQSEGQTHELGMAAVAKAADPQGAGEQQ